MYKIRPINYDPLKELNNVLVKHQRLLKCYQLYPFVALSRSQLQTTVVVTS